MKIKIYVLLLILLSTLFLSSCGKQEKEGLIIGDKGINYNDGKNKIELGDNGIKIESEDGLNINIQK